YDTAKCCFISHRWQSLNAAPVQKLKKRGVPVLSWTIKTPEQEAEARIIADNVTFEGYTPVT
ncbi:MAG: glycerophosphodiester phosphodiesterase family protein, partial [Alphaproteobacteria bacterium]